jgi:hypothetical protein
VDALTGTLGPKICEEGLKKQIERVEAVVSLATEKGMSVTDFLALEDAEDRITRRTIPKRRDYLERSQAEKSSIEGLPELFRELVISLTSNLMGVEESELEREMTDSREVRAAMDTARQRTAAVSDALGEWYEKEADRIYGPPAQAET